MSLTHGISQRMQAHVAFTVLLAFSSPHLSLARSCDWLWNTPPEEQWAMATSRSSIVQSGAVARSQLRRPCARAFHWTVAPFVVLYASVVGCYVSAAFEAHGEWLLLALPAILMAQLLAFLACQWSVKFKALATTSSCGIDAIERLIASASSSSTSASSSSSVLVLVEPKFGKGKSALCEVRWRPIAGSTGEVYFHWREEKFVWHADDATFVKQRYPTVLSFGVRANHRTNQPIESTNRSSQRASNQAIDATRD